MVNYTLKVISIRKETTDTNTIVFKQPGLKKIKYLAGQYLTLIFKINNRKYIRPYSFSSAPGFDANLEITVKRVPGGVVSNHIIDKLAVGDVVEVIEPMGDFTIHNEFINNNTHIVLWGAGSGITPLFSLAKYALQNSKAQHITLVYGNRSFESVIFDEQLRALKQQYDKTFSIWHFHTQAVIYDDNPYVVQGRIDPEKVLSVMNQEGDLSKTVHYICGPTGLKESVKNILSDLKIENSQVFSEDFEIVTNPKDFEEIITRTINIRHESSITTLEVVKGKSILEAGLDAMINMSYSCQTGSCLICKGTLLSGEVKTIGIDNLPSALNNNERLLCCSYPLTDNVEISI